MELIELAIRRRCINITAIYWTRKTRRDRRNQLLHHSVLHWSHRPHKITTQRLQQSMNPKTVVKYNSILYKLRQNWRQGNYIWKQKEREKIHSELFYLVNNKELYYENHSHSKTERGLTYNKLSAVTKAWILHLVSKHLIWRSMFTSYFNCLFLTLYQLRFVCCNVKLCALLYYYYYYS